MHMAVMKAVKVTTENELSVVDLEREPDGTLYKALRKEFGGNVEHVRLYGYRPYCLIIDETGRLKGLPANKAASWLYRGQGRSEKIVGPALVLKETVTGDGDIDVEGLDDEECRAISHRLAMVIKTE